MVTKTLLTSMLFMATAWSQPARPLPARVIHVTGTLEATATITELPPTPFVFVRYKGSATVDDLGRMTFDEPHIVNLNNNTGVGTLVLIAANGDMITANLTGQATETGPGKFDIVEDVSITGGTGRFANATGSLRMERSFDFATNATRGSITGMIVLAK